MENINNISRELLLASIKYEMEDLKAVCYEYIISIMDLANAIHFLIFAYENQFQELQVAASLFVKKHFKAIKEKTNGFEMLDGAHLRLVLNVLGEAL